LLADYNLDKIYEPLISSVTIIICI